MVPAPPGVRPDIRRKAVMVQVMRLIFNTPQPSALLTGSLHDDDPLPELVREYEAVRRDLLCETHTRPSKTRGEHHKTSCEITTAGSLLTPERQAHPHTTPEEEQGPPQGAEAPPAHPGPPEALPPLPGGTQTHACTPPSSRPGRTPP